MRMSRYADASTSLAALLVLATACGRMPATLELGPAAEHRPLVVAVEADKGRTERVVVELPSSGHLTLLEIVSMGRISLLRVAAGAPDTLLSAGRHALSTHRGPEVTAAGLRVPAEPPAPGAPRGDWEDVARARTEACPDAPPSATGDVPRCLARPWVGPAPVHARRFLVAVVTKMPVDPAAFTAGLDALPISHRADDMVESAVECVARAAGEGSYGATAREL